MLAYLEYTPHPFLWKWGDGPWGIRYYGVAYLLGFLALYVGLRLFYKKGWSPLNKDQVADFVTYVVVGVLVGGRLGYCFFYDFAHILRHPIDVIAFWKQGGISGMASHGGFLGVMAAVYLYSRRRRVPFWTLIDNAVTLAPVGLFFGRIANFLNGELWGRVTNVPWALIFPDPYAGGLPRHPSQLYEAFGEGVFLFAMMLWVRSRNWRGGMTSIVFLWAYAVIRIVVEQFREPDAPLTLGFTRGQALSVGLIVLGIALWIFRSTRFKKEKTD